MTVTGRGPSPTSDSHGPAVSRRVPASEGPRPQGPGPLSPSLNSLHCDWSTEGLQGPLPLLAGSGDLLLDSRTEVPPRGPGVTGCSCSLRADQPRPQVGPQGPLQGRGRGRCPPGREGLLGGGSGPVKGSGSLGQGESPGGTPGSFPAPQGSGFRGKQTLKTLSLAAQTPEDARQIQEVGASLWVGRPPGQLPGRWP